MQTLNRGHLNERLSLFKWIYQNVRLTNLFFKIIILQTA